MTVKIFTALDFDTRAAALEMYRKLRSINPYFKIGLELYTHAGPDFVRELVADGAEIFLDLKFHDIPNTVAGAIRQAARLGVRYTNVHICGGQKMVEAACEALAQESSRAKNMQLLGVTVLTSLNSADLSAIGVHRKAVDQVFELAHLGAQWGLDGIVCSAQELPIIRKKFLKDFITMVPGIRPAGTDKGDQNRVATPKEAADWGADCLVIGRPITKAKDPAAVLRSVLESL